MWQCIVIIAYLCTLPVSIARIPSQHGDTSAYSSWHQVLAFMQSADVDSAIVWSISYPVSRYSALRIRFTQIRTCLLNLFPHLPVFYVFPYEWETSMEGPAYVLWRLSGSGPLPNEVVMFGNVVDTFWSDKRLFPSSQPFHILLIVRADSDTHSTFSVSMLMPESLLAACLQKMPAVAPISLCAIRQQRITTFAPEALRTIVSAFPVMCTDSVCIFFDRSTSMLYLIDLMKEGKLRWAANLLTSLYCSEIFPAISAHTCSNQEELCQELTRKLAMVSLPPCTWTQIHTSLDRQNRVLLVFHGRCIACTTVAHAGKSASPDSAAVSLNVQWVELVLAVSVDALLQSGRPAIRVHALHPKPSYPEYCLHTQMLSYPGEQVLFSTATTVIWYAYHEAGIHLTIQRVQFPAQTTQCTIPWGASPESSMPFPPALNPIQNTLYIRYESDWLAEYHLTW